MARLISIGNSELAQDVWPSLLNVAKSPTVEQPKCDDRKFYFPMELSVPALGLFFW